MRALPCLCLALLLPASAVAYVRSTTFNTMAALRWMGSNCILVRVNSKGSQDVPGAPAVNAAKRALDNWQTATAGCSYLRFQILPDSPDAVASFDKESDSNENVIVWVESGWEELGGAHDPQAAALTTVFFIEKAGNPADGQIIDADIELNGEFFRFSASGAAGLTDIENTLTHEIGHMLGLDHPCDDNLNDNRTPKDNLGNPIPYCYPVQRLPAWIREVTMYNFADLGETKKRSLEADDIAGICDIYPKSADPGQCGPAKLPGTSGGCALGVAPASPGAAAALLLAGAVLIFARSRRRR